MQQAIDRFFKTVTFTAFSGSLQSLSQIISRGTGTYVNGYAILEYLYSNNGVRNYSVKLYFVNDEVNVALQTCE